MPSTKTKPCRDCGAAVHWWRTAAGEWRLYETIGIPFLPNVDGIALHPARGWIDAGTAWPEPSEMAPRHRCACREIADALAPVGDVLTAWLDEWGPLAYPKPARTPERKRA